MLRPAFRSRLALTALRGKRTLNFSALDAMIPDRVFYPLAILVAAGLIVLALSWPQGQGTPAPDPFQAAAARVHIQ
jgi:hypothetical protein